MTNNPELRTVGLQWNDDFASKINEQSLAMLVDAVAIMPPSRRGEFISKVSVAYAADTSGEERMAVVITHPQNVYLNVRRHHRVVVGCAPLQGDMGAWNIGVGEEGEGLGTYDWQGSPRMAVAMPIGRAGLRLWLGRFRWDMALSPEDPMPTIDRVFTDGLLVSGETAVDIGEPLPGIPRAELPRLAPNIVIVEPPAALR